MSKIGFIGKCCSLRTLFSRFSNFALNLLLRGLLHIIYLTPRPKLFPQSRKEAPYLSAVFGSNLFCAFRHVHYSLPQGSEIDRGYLHGNIVIDFVGQKAPTSKAYLIIFDLALLILQLLLLAARTRHSGLEQFLAADGSSGATVRQPVESLTNSANTTVAQTYDAEERGVQKREELEVAEMQSDTDTCTDAFNDSSYRTMLSELDSGMAIVANLCIFDVFHG